MKSLEIETAGYVLLAHANENDINAALPVMKWLIQQRSPYGGFISTQVSDLTEYTYCTLYCKFDFLRSERIKDGVNSAF